MKKYYPSLEDNDEIIDESSMPIYERLTHTLLDEILAYSDDACVGILPRVCKSWYNEIGSPSLWSMLLDRHGWHMSANDNGDSGGSGREYGSDDEVAGDDYLPSDDEVLPHCKQLRKIFLSHYSVLRDVRALSNASTYMAWADKGGMSMGNNTPNKLGLESAIHMYNSSSKRYSSYTRYIVKIWSEDETNVGVNAKALATDLDCTLRLFEAVRGNSDCITAQGCGVIKCRQVAGLRAAPPFLSKKNGRCALIGMDMDEDHVACLVGELDRYLTMTTFTKWLTVLPRDDLVCAGNEGLLDDSIQSFDLRGVVIDFILNGAEGDVILQDFRVALHDYLATIDGDSTAVNLFVVRAKLISCGKGNFLFCASISVPRSFHPSEDEEVRDDEGDLCHCHDRLFLFSVRTGSIVNSLHLERVESVRGRDISLFASRPFKHRSVAYGNEYDVLRTNILISGLSTELSVVSVEIGRTGSTDIFNTAMIECEQHEDHMLLLNRHLLPKAVLTSSYAVCSTDSPNGAVLHFHNLHRIPYRIGVNMGSHPIVLGSRRCQVHNMFIVREHYIAIVILDKASDAGEEDDGAFDVNNWRSRFVKKTQSIVVYHIPTAQEICRCPIPISDYAFDCIGDTLVMNVPHLGFVITGGDARDVGRVSIPSTDMAQTMMPPSIKQPNRILKRLASLVSGRKKYGFARGMSLRG